jgi:anthranilate synthase component 1
MNQQEFLTLAANANYTALSLEFLTDCDTPVSIYAKLANCDNTFLLESVSGGEKWGRYSIIGLSSSILLKAIGSTVEIIKDNCTISTVTTENPLNEVQNFLATYQVAKMPDIPKFFGGFVGYFAYDIARYENHKLQATIPDNINVPDILLMLCSDLVLVDNLKNQVHLITIVDTTNKSRLQEIYQENVQKLQQLKAKLQEPFASLKPLVPSNNIPEKFEMAFSKETFINNILKIKQYILNGDLMQVVLSQRFILDFDEHKAFDLYRALRYINPSPYLYYINFQDIKIVGSSPEVLVRFEDDIITIRPIAGTRRRGQTLAEDELLEAELMQDEKELAEHTMLIDLARNDVGRVAKYGTINLTDKMIIEKYQTVMHIVSNVQGQVKDGLNAMQILKSALPAGTLSGAPKIRAMQVIDELENLKRGIYGGAVGYLGFDGNLDTAIAIRTAIITNGKCYVQAGAGIVADSNPESEWEEVLNKRLSVFRALAMLKDNS